MSSLLSSVKDIVINNTQQGQNAALVLSSVLLPFQPSVMKTQHSHGDLFEEGTLSCLANLACTALQWRPRMIRFNGCQKDSLDILQVLLVKLHWTNAEMKLLRSWGKKDIAKLWSHWRCWGRGWSREWQIWTHCSNTGKCICVLSNGLECCRDTVQVNWIKLISRSSLLLFSVSQPQGCFRYWKNNKNITRNIY